MRVNTRTGTALVALLVLLAGCVGAASPNALADEPAPAVSQADDSTPTVSVSGSATVETRRAMGRLQRDNITAFLDGRTPPTPVN